jgi:hypothetical protein
MAAAEWSKTVSRQKSSLSYGVSDRDRTKGRLKTSDEKPVLQQYGMKQLTVE